MDSQEFQNEQIILGNVLKYGDEAWQIVKDLTHNRFVYDKNGKLGGRTHMQIWQALVMCVAERSNISIANVVSHLGERELQEYLQSLVGRLEGYYGIYDLDRHGLVIRVDEADKLGILFNSLARQYRDASKVVKQEDFEAYARTVSDIDEWVAREIGALSGITRDTNTSGYKHISVYADSVSRKHEMIREGLQPMLLQTGIGPIDAWGLNANGYLSVGHGMSSAGKSALVHSIDLGTAIGLKVNDIKGCVAVNSLEMTGDDLVERWASILSGYDLFRLKQGPSELIGKDYDNFAGWREVIATLPIYIDESDLLTTTVMDYRASELYSGPTGPIWRLSTDFIELFDDRAESMEQTMASIIKKHKSMARNLGMHVCAISQSTEGAAGRFNPSRIAGPEGTRYSRAIRNAADIIFEVYNPPYMRSANIPHEVPEHMDENSAWVLVQKYRHGGITGEFPLGWEPSYTRFYDPMYNHGAEKGALFNHMGELAETLEVTGTATVAPQDTTIGEDFGF